LATPTERDLWNSKLGFVLAASGSAIGLGNIVFFASNAYQYGGGAFYLPYFVALFALGIPVMIVEFGLGASTRQALPQALRAVAGRRGEFVGWWSLSCALLITMYYVAILGWALGMMAGALGGLFEPGATAPFEPFASPSAGVDATAFFFGMIATWWPMLAVLVIWLLNGLILARGTRTIERAVRIFVPLMWLFMIGLIALALTREGGLDGVLYLFTPDLAGIGDPAVWKGAFAQMFFSLSLGLGTMTAYASYLPRRSDVVNSSLLVSFMNCGFEFLAGVAIFGLLFAFALNPVGGTLSLSFFVIPQGIATFGPLAKPLGFAFFFLLVVAGLTSSISLIEGPAAALRDKLGLSRARALAVVFVPGALGSLAYTLPLVVDPGLAGSGTLGLSLLDIMDHWVFNYSLLVVGLLQVLFVGWVLGASRLREAVNRHARLRLGAWFDAVIKFVAPGLLGFVLVWSLAQEFGDGLYASSAPLGAFGWLPVAVPLFWLAFTLGAAAYLTALPSPAPPAPFDADDEPTAAHLEPVLS
jgi:NSS family neurotransmitter:Na+ symporter